MYLECTIRGPDPKILNWCEHYIRKIILFNISRNIMDVRCFRSISIYLLILRFWSGKENFPIIFWQNCPQISKILQIVYIVAPAAARKIIIKKSFVRKNPFCFKSRERYWRSINLDPNHVFKVHYKGHRSEDFRLCEHHILKLYYSTSPKI